MTLAELPSDKKVILFDGVCNLCNASVLFILKRDKRDRYRFVPQQSTLGQAIVAQLNLNDPTIDSIVLYEPHKTVYIKSAAALRILIGLGGIYNIARIFLVFPTGVCNIVYNYIAQNRYRWYGKRDTCMVATADVLKKFLS